MSTFGENLRELRRSRGYTQDRFARICGTNQVNISAWEIGSRMPSISTIRRIADTFHVPVSSLISIEDSGMQDDLVQQVTDLFKQKPKLRTLISKAQYLSDYDLDVLIQVAVAVSREREETGEHT